MLDHARTVGGPALRKLTFHDRARIIKGLGLAILARKEELYELNYLTGATRKDGWIDIEGGAGTLLSFSSKGRRELPDAHVLLDGAVEPLSKSGSFIGQHIYSPMTGCRGPHQRLQLPRVGDAREARPDPARRHARDRQTGQLDRLSVRSRGADHDRHRAAPRRRAATDRRRGRRPVRPSHRAGRGQLHRLGLDRAQAASRIPPCCANRVKFVAEQDSLNASILGPDAAPGTPEFDLFVKEVVNEMTAKAGQKCTAIRRAIVPAAHLDAVEVAIAQKLEALKVGDPRDKASGMGALVSCAQRDDVRGQVEKLVAAGARIVSGNLEAATGPDGGAFMQPDPASRRRSVGRAARSTTSRRSARSRRSCPTATSPTPSRSPIAAWAASRCRCSATAPTRRATSSSARRRSTAACWSSTATMPPTAPAMARRSPCSSTAAPGAPAGRRRWAGCAGSSITCSAPRLQSTPAMIAAISSQYIPDAPKKVLAAHPFRKRMSELHIGDTLRTASRTVTIADIEHFADFTGDNFYAHMDEEAAKASPIFEGRVAHGYLILSFAAGLFVDPDPGPVLANTGLENLKFLTPLYPDDSMRVELTVRSKSLKSEDTGVVRWAVEIFNQKDELVATYDLLTENTP